jgi:hypothetical protein
MGLGSYFYTIKHFGNKGGAKILYFEKKACSTKDGLITRTIRLSWPTNLFFKLHSCKHNLHNSKANMQ